MWIYVAALCSASRRAFQDFHGPSPYRTIIRRPPPGSLLSSPFIFSKPCRYLPLAVTALAEMNRRADIYLSSSLTPRLRELSGAIMALAAGNDLRGDRVLEVRTGHADKWGGLSDLPQALIIWLRNSFALLPAPIPVLFCSRASPPPPTVRSLP